MAERTWAGRARLLTTGGETALTGEARLSAIKSASGETWGGTIAVDQPHRALEGASELTLQLDDSGAKAAVGVRLTGMVSGRSKVRSLFTIEGRGNAPF